MEGKLLDDVRLGCISLSTRVEKGLEVPVVFCRMLDCQRMSVLERISPYRSGRATPAVEALCPVEAEVQT